MAFNKAGGKKPSGPRTGARAGSRTGGSTRNSSNSYGGSGGGGERFSRGGRNSMRKKQNKFFTVFSPEQEVIDYKDSDKLLRFTTEKGKIVPRRITGLTAKQQKMVARAVKRARHSGFLAFQAD
jgi:small subunit ribosomal protein S18